MMTKIKGEFVCECDDCGDTLETGETNFHEALAVVKTNRWRPYKEDDVWKHSCGCDATEQP